METVRSTAAISILYVVSTGAAIGASINFGMSPLIELVPGIETEIPATIVNIGDGVLVLDEYSYGTSWRGLEPYYETHLSLISGAGSGPPSGTILYPGDHIDFILATVAIATCDSCSGMTDVTVGPVFRDPNTNILIAEASVDVIFAVGEATHFSPFEYSTPVPIPGALWLGLSGVVY